MTQHPKFIKLNIGPTIGTALDLFGVQQEQNVPKQ